MAKFRTNHQRQKSGPGSGTAVKFGLFAMVMAGLFYVFNKFSGGDAGSFGEDSSIFEIPSEKEDNIELPKSTILNKILPSSTTGVVIKHEYYALSYSEKHEQAEWVAYELTRDRLNNRIAQRSNNFRPDPKINSGSSEIFDYKNSGFDRGHLVPAGDMGFSQRSMSQTFYMSNISPQLRNFNGGIWRELEENVRDWARRFRHLYIVSGPVLDGRPKAKIGRNKVTVPEKFFKVVLDISEPELKAIAFVIPNELTEKPIDAFAVTIDEVEELTGIDFFGELLEENLEEELEGVSEPELWRYSQKRYELRVKEWNKR